MQTTLYMPGEHPVGISGFVTVRPYERTPGVFELDADRDQVAQQLGGRADLTWADSHAAVFGLASVGGHALNPAATEAVNYLLRVRKGPQFDTLKGPVLVVQQDDPTREVVQLVVSNDHLSVFSDFIGRYHDQRDDALAEAAEEHYREWLETAEPGDQYTVSENDHSLDPEPNDFEVIHVEAGMFSAVYHLIFASAHCALHFGLKWGEQRAQLATPGALAHLSEEEQAKLRRAGSLPNSWEAIAALRRLATPGWWQTSEQGIVAVVDYEEDGEHKARATPLVLTAANQAYICRLHNIAMRLVWRQLVPPALPVGQAHYPPLVSSENVLVRVVFSPDVALAFSAAARNNSLVQVLSEVPFQMGELDESVQFVLSATHAQYLFWLAYHFGRAQQAAEQQTTSQWHAERLPDAVTNAIGLLEHLGREHVAEHLQKVAIMMLADARQAEEFKAKVVQVLTVHRNGAHARFRLDEPENPIEGARLYEVNDIARELGLTLPEQAEEQNQSAA